MDFNPELVYDLFSNRLPATNPFVTSDMTVREARIASMRQSLFKKWLPSDAKPLEAVAISTFLTSDRHCEEFSISEDSYYYDTLMLARDAIHRQVYSCFDSTAPTLTDFLQMGRSGPGASIATRHTDFFHKMFAGRLSTTSKGLYQHYVGHISGSWLKAELSRHAAYGLDVVRGSKLGTVPKNRETNRTICTEPSLNMFYQLGAGACIEKLLLRYHNIDLSLQPKRNRTMARLGSIDGEYCTIDLKSASDTISTTLVRWLLPRSLYASLDLIRSRETEVDGEYRRLNMFSSMGNGFTFPLQTYIFASLVRACYDSKGINPYSYKHGPAYSVFGDDIICTRDVYDSVVSLLEYAGFIVNRTKSYCNGPFRESCGSDFFEGHDIRGVYLKEITNESTTYSAFNRVARWSARYNIDASAVLAYLKDRAVFRPIPLDAPDSEGFKVPQAFLRSPKSDRNGALFYKALVPLARKIRIRDSNAFADGAVISNIGGYIREQSVTLRSSGEPRFKVVRRKTPSWDYIPDPGLTIRDLYTTLLLAL